MRFERLEDRRLLTVNVVNVSTSGSTGQTFTLGGSAVAVDSGISVTSSDTDITGASMTLANFQPGDSLNYTPLDSITILSNSGGALSLTGSATPAEYSAALQSVTFSTTSIDQATRTIDVVADDNSVTSTPGVDTVNVAIAAPVVTANQTSVGATAGQTVSVDSAVTVQSFDTDVTGATMTIGTGYQSGSDTLNFVNQNGITGNYSAGVLTLSGSATPAQYQAALQSVTFSSASTSVATRNISIVVQDAGDTGNVSSNDAATQIVVSAPVTVSAVYVSGSSWTADFDTYLAGHGLGSATYGYALQTGANQLTALPWTNIDTIDVQFSGPVTGIAQTSLELLGGSGGSTPSVTGFTSLGNDVYQWTLSGPLTNNRYAISVASTTSQFGPAVVDSHGAGISGSFTTSSSSFPSGNGLAGGTFDFFFNVLPGNVNRGGIDNATGINDVRLLDSGTRPPSASYNPYYDVLGAGGIDLATLNAVRGLTGRLPIASPIVLSDAMLPTAAAHPAASPSKTGFTDLELAVQEAGTSRTNTAPTSNVVSAGMPAIGTTTAGTTTAGTTTVGTKSPDTVHASSLSTVTSTTGSRDHARHSLAAIDEAVSEFDLADLRV